MSEEALLFRHLGAMYAAEGEPEKAIQAYETVLRLGRGDSTVAPALPRATL